VDDLVTSGLAVLHEEECWRRLARRPVHWLAFTDDDDLHVLPVNAVVVDRTLAFRTGPGRKLEAARAGRRMAMTAGSIQVEAHRAWSVTARGTPRIATDPDELARLDRLPLRPWVRTAVDGAWIVVDVDTVTGRVVDPSAPRLIRGPRQ
jgi:hypothetical protein